jgi:hypothetical protein
MYASGRVEIMRHDQTASDVGLKQSFTSSGPSRTLTDVEVAERLGVSRFTVRYASIAFIARRATAEVKAIPATVAAR